MSASRAIALVVPLQEVQKEDMFTNASRLFTNGVFDLQFRDTIDPPPAWSMPKEAPFTVRAIYAGTCLQFRSCWIETARLCLDHASYASRRAADESVLHTWLGYS